MKRIINITALLFMLISASACSDYGARLRDGYRHLDEGRFDSALEQFQKASLYKQDAAELQVGMGLVLSLKRVSQRAAVELLERSLVERTNRERRAESAKNSPTDSRSPEGSQKGNEKAGGTFSEELVKRGGDDIRQELLLLYLDMGLLDTARRMLESVTYEKLFTARIRMMRMAVRCAQNPRQSNVERLIKLKTENIWKDYFITRCYLSFRNKKDELPEKALKNAVEVFQRAESDLIRCELLTIWPPAHHARINYSAEKKKTCLEKYPGQVSLHRERPVDYASLKARTRTHIPFSELSELPPYEPHNRKATLDAARELGN